MAVSKIKPIAENVSDKFTINAAWTSQQKKAWKILVLALCSIGKGN